MGTRNTFGMLLCTAAVPVCFGGQWMHLRQFADDPMLTAARGQVVVLDALPEESEPARIRYRLAMGEHEFCLSADARFFSGMAIDDDFDREIQRIEKNSKCVKMTLPAGTTRYGFSANLSGIPHQSPIPAP